MPISDSIRNRGLNCLTPARTAELQWQVFRRFTFPLCQEGCREFVPHLGIPWNDPRPAFLLSLEHCAHRMPWIEVLHPGWMEVEHGALPQDPALGAVDFRNMPSWNWAL